MARRKRGSKAPRRVKGLPKGGRLYGAGARKAAANMAKEYGPGWQRVFYALANKRAGKGVKGAHRMHGVSSRAYAKGSHWGNGRPKGHRVSVRTQGKVNVTHRSRHAHIRIKVY